MLFVEQSKSIDLNTLSICLLLRLVLYNLEWTKLIKKLLISLFELINSKRRLLWRNKRLQSKTIQTTY